jgi:hypothetical protein
MLAHTTLSAALPAPLGRRLEATAIESLFSPFKTLFSPFKTWSRATDSQPNIPAAPRQPLAENRS